MDKGQSGTGAKRQRVERGMSSVSIVRAYDLNYSCRVLILSAGCLKNRRWSLFSQSMKGSSIPRVRLRGTLDGIHG